MSKHDVENGSGPRRRRTTPGEKTQTTAPNQYIVSKHCQGFIFVFPFSTIFWPFCFLGVFFLWVFLFFLPFHSLIFVFFQKSSKKEKKEPQKHDKKKCQQEQARSQKAHHPITPRRPTMQEAEQEQAEQNKPKPPPQLLLLLTLLTAFISRRSRSSISRLPIGIRPDSLPRVLDVLPRLRDLAQDGRRRCRPLRLSVVVGLGQPGRRAPRRRWR